MTENDTTATAPEHPPSSADSGDGEAAGAGPVSFAVRISEDKVSVLLDSADPLADIALTVERIIAEFEDLQLPEFPDRNMLAEMLRNNCSPGRDVQDFPLIMGMAPVEAQDGRLDWSKDYFAEGWAIDEETGSVDFWEKVDNRSVTEGELLVTVSDPVEGEPGLSVFNVKIPVDKPAKVRLRLGKGVREEAVPQGTLVFATLNGRLRDTDGTISVDEVFQVKGNVSLETGNLHHSGTVVVEGDILEGATLEVGGDLIVKGMIEPSNIQVGGGLSVAGGIASNDGCLIQVGGDLHAKYIHEAVIRAGGDIHVVNEIAHSDIRTRGKVEIPKGRIAGGYTLARRGITVGEAGAEGSSKTTLVAGIDPTLKPAVKSLRETIQNLEEARGKIKRALENAMMREESLTDDERQLVAGLAARRARLEDSIAEAEGVITRLMHESLLGARLEVIMLKEVRSGTTIQLGEQKTLVRSSILKPRIAQRREDRVRVLPLGEGNMPGG